MQPGKSIAAWLPLTLGFLLVAAAFATPASQRGAVTVTFPTGTAPPRTIRQVAIVSADTLEVLDSVSIARKRQVVLRPTPGVLFAAATDVAVRGARSGASRVFLVDPTLVTSAPIRPRRGGTGPATALRGAATAATGIAAAMGGGTVYTMGGIPVTNGGPLGSLGHGLLTGIFDATHDSGARWVGSDPKVIEARARELQLQADGRLDPNTPIRDERLTPTLRVEGELT